MITIDNRKHGFVLHLEGRIEADEVRNLQMQLRDEWAGVNGPFVLQLDVRLFKHFTADAQALFEEMLEEALLEGLTRLTTVGISTAFAHLFCNIMVRTEIMPIYQFLDLAYEEDWEGEMEEWLMAPFEEDELEAGA